MSPDVAPEGSEPEHLIRSPMPVGPVIDDRFVLNRALRAARSSSIPG
jgi:hypothetical protein